ncbi:MAG: energy-coupling factor ABC transporter ATP-binding protein [Anaerolineae bacterium]
MIVKNDDQPLVLIEALHFAYPPLQPGGESVAVLQGVHLQVAAGECLAVMGPTGAGKTTLCLALNGLVPQATGGDFEGRIVVAGRDTRQHSVAALSQMAGLVFQDPEAQLFSMSVEEEVAFGLESLGLPQPVMAERIAWALSVVRLEGVRNRSPYQLSGGQKKRLAIAAVLAMRPAILILDEPTAGLDPVGKIEVLRVVAELRRLEGTTVILVEQDPEVVASFADRVAVLDEGHIVRQGSPRAVLSDVEALHRLGLAAPQISELASRLNHREGTAFAFITEGEAYQALRNDLGCANGE